MSASRRLLSLTMVASLALLRTYLVPLFYSTEYNLASSLMRLTLAGDFLKLVSWTLSLPLIADRAWGRFLACELLAWGTFWYVPTVCPGTSSERAAIGYTACYLIHALACLAVRSWRWR